MKVVMMKVVRVGVHKHHPSIRTLKHLADSDAHSVHGKAISR